MKISSQRVSKKVYDTFIVRLHDENDNMDVRVYNIPSDQIRKANACMDRVIDYFYSVKSENIHADIDLFELVEKDFSSTGIIFVPGHITEHIVELDPACNDSDDDDDYDCCVDCAECEYRDECEYCDECGEDDDEDEDEKDDEKPRTKYLILGRAEQKNAKHKSSPWIFEIPAWVKDETVNDVICAATMSIDASGEDESAPDAEDGKDNVAEKICAEFKKAGVDCQYRDDVDASAVLEKQFLG
ncbi:MAG: hypothetical protein IJI14_00465 [Anaerolineaceae bacterium]|nr:hypothetical protein [Anaerolineaceae bacterium]